MLIKSATSNSAQSGYLNRFKEVEVVLCSSYIAVLSTHAGFTVCKVEMEECTVRISELLTEEAVASLISTSVPVDPLFYITYQL